MTLIPSSQSERNCDSYHTVHKYCRLSQQYLYYKNVFYSGACFRRVEPDLDYCPARDLSLEPRHCSFAQKKHLRRDAILEKLAMT